MRPSPPPPVCTAADPSLPELFSVIKPKSQVVLLRKLIPADRAGMLTLANKLVPFGANLEQFCPGAYNQLKAELKAGEEAAATAAATPRASLNEQQEQQEQPHQHTPAVMSLDRSSEAAGERSTSRPSHDSSPTRSAMLDD